MGNVIDVVLPLAVGVALSPVPLIAILLMLLAPKAGSAAVGFLVGWLVGIVLAVSVFSFLFGFLPPRDENGTDVLGGVLKVGLGTALLVIAIRQWVAIPKAGAEPPLPGWMIAIDTMMARKAIVLSFLLAAVNPKNLLLNAAAGVAIGSSDLDAGAQIAIVILYTVIASASVGLPVMLYRIAGERMATPMERMRAWLEANNAGVMATLLTILSVVLIGKGLASF